MNTWTTILIVAVIVVVAVIALVTVMRARKRRSSGTDGIGLPELGALSMDGDDKKQTGRSPRVEETGVQTGDHSDSRSH